MVRARIATSLSRNAPEKVLGASSPSRAAELLRDYAPRLKADDVVKRLTSRTSVLCGSNLRQLDIAAGLLDKSPPSVNCR